jgi:hypothetical protein
MMHGYNQRACEFVFLHLTQLVLEEAQLNVRHRRGFGTLAGNDAGIFRTLEYKPMIRTNVASKVK